VGRPGSADSGTRNFFLNGLFAATSGALKLSKADLWKSAVLLAAAEILVHQRIVSTNSS
jgi:hypothetical protein